MNYENSKNDNEILSAEDESLREMCRSLKRVEAPNDFEFKLKARITDSKASDFAPRFGFAFRYALPALALILVLGLLVYNGGFFSSNNNQIVAGSETQPQNPILPQNSAVAVLPAPDQNANTVVLPANQESPNKIEKTPPQLADNLLRNPSQDSRENKKDSSGGSKDFASTEDKTRQVNFNSITIPKNSQTSEQVNPMSVKEILSQIGINASFENGKWTVKSVTANGIGENSGVKANDIVEAIDDQPLTVETINSKTVNGKTVTVTRNGEKSQIKLRVKQ